MSSVKFLKVIFKKSSQCPSESNECRYLHFQGRDMEEKVELGSSGCRVVTGLRMVWCSGILLWWVRQTDMHLTSPASLYIVLMAGWAFSL